MFNANSNLAFEQFLSVYVAKVKIDFINTCTGAMECMQLCKIWRAISDILPNKYQTRYAYACADCHVYNIFVTKRC